MQRILLALLLSASGLARAQEPLTTTASVRGLPSERAAQALPVRASGVLTWVDVAEGRELVLHDATGGIYVTLSAAQIEGELAAGSQAEVEGVTNPGGYAPVIDGRRVRVIGPGILPPARPVVLEDLQSGAFDSQRVEIRGVVQVAASGSGQRDTYLRVGTRGGRFGVNVRAEPGYDPTGLVDAEVRLRGVCFPFFNARRELLGVRLVVARTADIEVLRPPVEWPEVPLIALDRLLPFSPEGAPLHRRRVRGTVTLARPGEVFCVQEGDRAIRLETNQETVLTPGDRVEAIGFINRESFFAMLTEASFHVFERGTAPPPLPISPAEIRAGDLDARLVQIDGVLRKRTALPSEQRLHLEADNEVFEVTLAGSEPLAAEWREGSVVRATGVLNVLYRGRPDRPSFPNFEGFRLQLRSPADVQLLRAAPWWNTQRLAAALSGTGLVLALALGWAWLLRRQVEERTAQLGAEIQARHDTRLEYEATWRERRRLAGDLHDTVEQAFTAVSFQFQTARALRERDPARAEHHLALAEDFLSRSRDDLRRSVWDLRTEVLEGRTLAEALRHHCAQLSAERAVACEVFAENEKPLPELIAGHLFLFAQEALNNTLKHARATRATIHLASDESAVRLTIHDDGCGFDPAAVPGPAEGHFGLTGLRERIHRLSGTFQIESEPGRGTRVTAAILAQAWEDRAE